METIHRRRTHGPRSLAVPGRGRARFPDRAGSAAPGASSAVEPDIDPASLTRGIEASLLHAGLAAYYAVIAGALALVRPQPPGLHLDVRA
ncbi:MAG: hypothetical protein Kow0010_25650 [Dehalococcoidia bacterium]